MTTIAYKNGVMAGDQRVTMGGVISPTLQVEKVFRFATYGREVLYGIAGDLAQTQIMRHWFEDEFSLWYGDLTAIHFDETLITQDEERATTLLASDGSIIVIVNNDGSIVQFTETKATAIAMGSGENWAEAAMAAGASAEEAVRIASQFDPGTGPDVMAVALWKG